MKNKQVLLAFLAGISAGALIGVLVAPRKGSSTRKKIAEQGEDYFGSLKDKYGDLLYRLNEKLDALKDEAAGVAGERMSRY
jgi:gas vesicle protein